MEVAAMSSDITGAAENSNDVLINGVDEQPLTSFVAAPSPAETSIGVVYTPNVNKRPLNNLDSHSSPLNDGYHVDGAAHTEGDDACPAGKVARVGAANELKPVEAKEAAAVADPAVPGEVWGPLPVPAFPEDMGHFGCAAGGESQAQKDLIKEVMRLYNAEIQKILPQAKADMTADSHIKKIHPLDLDNRLFGQLPGIPVGLKLNGRCEASVIGIHRSPMRGIDWRAKSLHIGAYAICLGGGYKDDDDEGDKIIYTGEGGQGNGKVQVTDQVLKRNGNEALLRNMLTRTPVRVIRGTPEATDSRYVYEGLYMVQGCRCVKSGAARNGPKVFQFLARPTEQCRTARTLPDFRSRGFAAGRASKSPMLLSLQRVPGHGKDPEQRLEYKGMHRAKLRLWENKSLSSSGERRDGKRIRRLNPEDLREREEKRLVSLQARKAAGENLLSFDISNGVECVRIPCFNDTGNGDTQPLPEGFQYILCSREQMTAEAAKILALPLDLFDLRLDAEGRVPPPCPAGRAYTGEGVLRGGRLEGVHEKALNDVVSSGPRLPLEVFRTRHRGWGLRCSEEILAGQFVCEYVGAVLSDEKAELLGNGGNHEYIFSLDHFFRHDGDGPDEAEADGAEPGAAAAAGAAGPAGPEKRRDWLCVNALNYGNVARFINHASTDGSETLAAVAAAAAAAGAGPAGTVGAEAEAEAANKAEEFATANLCIQVVHTEKDSMNSPLLHRIGLFADRDIKPNEELLYCYGDGYFFKTGDKVSLLKE